MLFNDSDDSKKKKKGILDVDGDGDIDFMDAVKALLNTGKAATRLIIGLLLILLCCCTGWAFTLMYMFNS